MDEDSPTDRKPRGKAGAPAISAAGGRRKWLLGGLALFFLLCGAAYGGYWVLIGRFQESTDDAYVAGNIVPLTSRVNGTVVAIRADNTQRVQEGQTLVLIDGTDARIALEQAEARLAQTVRQVQGLYQTGFCQRSDESVEAAVFNSDISNCAAFRQDHSVDHMDDTIAGLDIGDNDFGIIYHHFTHIGGNINVLALNRLGLVQFDHIRCHHFAFYDVVEKDISQCRNIC